MGSVLSLDSMLADLEYLVSIESPSHEIEAITRSAVAVRDVIERRLGHAAELVDSEAGPHVHAPIRPVVEGADRRSSRHRLPARSVGREAVRRRPTDEPPARASST